MLCAQRCKKLLIRYAVNTAVFSVGTAAVHASWENGHIRCEADADWHVQHILFLIFCSRASSSFFYFYLIGAKWVLWTETGSGLLTYYHNHKYACAFGETSWPCIVKTLRHKIKPPSTITNHLLYIKYARAWASVSVLRNSRAIGTEIQRLHIVDYIITAVFKREK